MLKLTVRAGEYLLIGDVKVVYTGGSGNNAHILVDAPKEMKIARSEVLEKYGMEKDCGYRTSHYRDKALSDEAKEQIKKIIMAERKTAKKEAAKRKLSEK